MPPEPRRLSIRLPHPQWIFVATVALIMVVAGLRIGVPIYQQRVAILGIKEYNGSVQGRRVGPEWLREWIGERRTEIVDPVDHVVFWADRATLLRRSRFGGIVVATIGPLVDNEFLACELRLPDLRSLDLAFSNVGDPGMEHVTCQPPPSSRGPSS